MVSTGEARPSFIHGEDGLLIQQPNGDPIREAKHIAVPKVPRTPRTPTIEKAHIERAYVSGDTPEQIGRAIRERERIEDYGAQDQKRWAELGAGVRIRGAVSNPISIAGHQEGEGPCVTMWGSELTGPALVLGDRDECIEERVECSACGGGITDPESYPRLNPRAGWVDCPFCGHKNGIAVFANGAQHIGGARA